MTKQEFLDGLSTVLSESGSQKLISDNRLFYEEFIDVEVKKGRTEEAVLGELGDPRLIANSILQAEGVRDVFAEGTKIYTAYDTPDGDPTTFAQGREYRGKSFEEQKADEEKKEQRMDKVRKAGSSVRSILFIILGVSIVLGIVALIIFAAGGILSILGPVLIPLIIIGLLFRLFRRN